MSTCTCGGVIRWRTSKRQGRVVIRYGACQTCGLSVKVLAQADTVKRRRRLTTVSAGSVVSGEDFEIGSECEPVLVDSPIQEIREMTKREKILRSLDAVNADQELIDLRRELSETRAAIEEHELTRLHARSIELSQRLRNRTNEVMEESARLESKLREEEPQVVHDLRVSLGLAFKRHQLVDAPTQLRDRYGNLTNEEEIRSWRDRGAGLLAASVQLRDAWKASDPLAVVRQLVTEHGAAVAELRYVSIPPETEHVTA